MYKFNSRVFFVGINAIFLVGCFEGWNFNQKVDNTIPSATLSLPMGNIYNVTILTCGARCKTEVNCLSFVYDQEYNKCVLYSENKPSVLVSPYVNLYVGKLVFVLTSLLQKVGSWVLKMNIAYRCVKLINQVDSICIRNLVLKLLMIMLLYE